ncbi:MAG: DUF6737 family protein [Cyanobacteriota bacterium]|jgi:hypothetical protein|nr:DUF6737 family protein [Cyanobacteriota bacterium]
MSQPLSPAALFWRQKPWWCQPWSILGTGSAAISALILAHHYLSVPLWLVVPPLLAVVAWWVLFLVIVPASGNHGLP